MLDGNRKLLAKNHNILAKNRKNVGQKSFKFGPKLAGMRTGGRPGDCPNVSSQDKGQGKKNVSDLARHPGAQEGPTASVKRLEDLGKTLKYQTFTKKKMFKNKNFKKSIFSEIWGVFRPILAD